MRAIADLYQLPSSPSDLSKIARQGSGSACRSLFGGYVAWEAGSQADGSDSLAVPVQPTAHWPGMRALILVASAKKKDVSSTAGMQATVATSALFGARVDKVVPERMDKMKEAIEKRDFETFGQLTMRDSNSFHATCADTWPPIFYMNDTSRAAVRLVEAINTAKGAIVAAYTFDAGPNAVVFYEDKNAEFVEKAFRKILGHVDGWKAGAGRPAPGEALPTPKKEIPSWLSKFSDALTMDAPNAGERDRASLSGPSGAAAAPSTTSASSLAAPSQQQQAQPTTPRRELAAPDWLRQAAEGLTREAPSYSTTDVAAAVNSAANDMASGASTIASQASTAATSAADTASKAAKATPAWLNKFAEALTADAPSMREEGDDSAGGAVVSKEEEAATQGEKGGAPGWLNKFAEALTGGTGTAGPRDVEEEETREEMIAEAAVDMPGAEVVKGPSAASAPAADDSKKEATPEVPATTVTAPPPSAEPTTTTKTTAEEKKQPQTQQGSGEVVYDERVVAALKEGVSRVIMTSIGEGPRSTRDHLIDEEGGVENRYSF